MRVTYSDHAQKRLKQRGVTYLEIEHVLGHTKYVKKSYDGTKVAVGEVNNRLIKVVFIEKQNYIKIVTIR